MPAASKTASRTVVAAQLAVFLVAAAILIPAVSPTEAIAGVAWVKLAFVARIAALVALALGMLR